MERGPRSPVISWIGLCAAAELLGIGAAAVWYGAINVWVGEPDAIAARLGAWLLMSLAAVPEGVVLGGLQAHGLRWFHGHVSTARWIAATTAVGFLGWGIGTFIPLFLVTGDSSAAAAPEPGLAATAGFAAIFGAAVGTVFGLAQSWALPKDVGRRWTWVLANAAGWSLGLPAIYLAAQIGADQSNVIVHIALWCVGGLAAGAAIGGATGVGLLAMRGARSPAA